MNFITNGAGSPPRLLLLGGTSEIGLAILASLGLPAGAEVILASRCGQGTGRQRTGLPGEVHVQGAAGLDMSRSDLDGSRSVDPPVEPMRFAVERHGRARPDSNRIRHSGERRLDPCTLSGRPGQCSPRRDPAGDGQQHRTAARIDA